MKNVFVIYSQEDTKQLKGLRWKSGDPYDANIIPTFPMIVCDLEHGLMFNSACRKLDELDTSAQFTPTYKLVLSREECSDLLDDLLEAGYTVQDGLVNDEPIIVSINQETKEATYEVF